MKKYLAAIAGVALCATAASAQDYPNKPIHVLTTSSAGGISDIFMRVLGEEMHKSLGQPIIIENRPGGAGNIATRACTEAAPDGYTICIINADPLIYNQYLFKNLPFDPEKDLEPVANLFINANTLAANSSLGVKTIPELVALAKSKPGTLSYGTFSFMLVYFMDKLNKDNGIDIIRVPFRSGNEMVNAVMTNTTPVVFLGLANMLGQIKSGQFKALALNSNVRSSMFPDIPTLGEAMGIDYPPPWFGLFAPAGTPVPIMEKINAEVQRITSEPGFRQKNYTDRAVEPMAGPREEFAKFIVANREFAARVAKESGIKPE